MLRQIANRIVGRKKKKEECITLEKVIEILENTKSEKNFLFGESIFDATPESCEIMADRIKSCYLPQHKETKYYAAKHEVYSGAKDEKHYFTISGAVLSGHSEKYMYRGPVFPVVEFSYILEC